MTRTSLPLGTIRICGEVDPLSDTVVEILEWTPGDQICDALPEYRLLMLCQTDSDGRRRFWPAGSPRDFAIVAALGGRAIQHRRHDAGPHQRFSDKLMSLVYQLGPRLREALGRTFRRRDDLLLSPSSRIHVDRSDILPDVLNADGTMRWSVDEWIRNGRQAATHAGVENPTDEVAIRYGLLEAARVDPIDTASLSTEEARALVRLALFDIGPTDQPDEAVRELVIDRLVHALEKHQDLNIDEFNTWFFSEFNNITHLIAKRKRGGGPLPRVAVRQAILETVFQAYYHVGVTVHVQMREFSRSLLPPLNADEQADFDAWFAVQPCLGNLPLLLICDLLLPFPELLAELESNPGDPRTWGTVLRALRLHSEMVCRKRESERRYKQEKVSAPPNFRDGVADVKICELATEWMEVNQRVCDCGASGAWHAVVVEFDLSRPVLLDIGCTHCGRSDSVELPLDFIRERFLE